MKNSIKDWPETERPAYRAKAQGWESLSDAEVLALVLKHKTYEKDEVTTARDLLSASGGLRGLLESENVLPKAKQTVLEAVQELGKRYLKEKMIGQNYIRSPQATVDYLTASMRDKGTEVFKVIFLDKSLRILSCKDMFFGTVDEAAIHPREVVKEALAQDASNVVFAHNHPSGKTEPSREDYEITQKLKAALQTVSIRVLDHVIIGENAYFSFSERNSL